MQVVHFTSNRSSKFEINRWKVSVKIPRDYKTRMCLASLRNGTVHTFIRSMKINSGFVCISTLYDYLVAHLAIYTLGYPRAINRHSRPRPREFPFGNYREFPGIVMSWISGGNSREFLQFQRELRGIHSFIVAYYDIFSVAQHRVILPSFEQNLQFSDVLGIGLTFSVSWFELGNYISIIDIEILLNRYISQRPTWQT